MSCPRIIAALNDCQRKHPRDSDVSRHKVIFSIKKIGASTLALLADWTVQQQISLVDTSSSCFVPLLWLQNESDIINLLIGGLTQVGTTALCCPALQLICASLTAAAGWCIFKGLCPAEVRSIEDCIGISNSSGRAPVIPARCADRAALLEACLESQQEIAEAKTGQCGGAQPIPKHKPTPAS
jgi:hypothetical protein